MNLIVDSYAWIEYFKGSKKAERMRMLLKSKDTSFKTAECCLGEIRAWSLVEKKEFEKAFEIIQSNSEIIPVFMEEWIEAAEERFEKRKIRKNFGLIDAILIVKQKQLNAKIITGDKHFKGLANIIYIGE